MIMTTLLRMIGGSRMVRATTARRFTSGLRWLVLATALFAGAIGLAALPAGASASAYGCTTSGAGLPWYGLNSAYTCIDVGGSGNTVWETSANWFGVGTICNYSFQIRWFDNNGRQYETDNSPLHAGCRGGADKWTENFGSYDYAQGYYNGVYKKSGKVCAYVIEAGSARGGVPCEYIN